VFSGNRVHDCRYGIHYMYSSDNVVARNELYRNVAGPALMFSRNLEVSDNVLHDHGGMRAYGLLLQNVDASVIRRNEIRGNRVGMRLQNSSASDFYDNRIVGNLAGITLNSSSRDNTFTRNRIGPNLRQMELTGPVPPTRWSVDGIGNRWSGVLPMDLTGDGVSEWPHHEVDLMAERREAFPPAALLTGSLGIRAVEWALSRAPVPGMRYITDPHPLTREAPRD
jgi:nitrous oxidase accessory protein